MNKLNSLLKFSEAPFYYLGLSAVLNSSEWSNQEFFQVVMGMIRGVWNVALASVNGKMVLAASLSAAIWDWEGIVPVDRRQSPVRGDH